jgi:predicted MPP superfamily phosphohydrolase
VNLTTTPYEWLGNPNTDALVFLGDYVDKGSASASVLKFVRALQETFPNNVVTMLGNHDFFLILDTALSFSKSNPHPLGHPFYDYAYSFMHPEEYIESEWIVDRSDDEELLGEILLGLSYIYDRNMQGSVHLCAPNCTHGQQDLFERVPPFDRNVTLKERAVERLNLWRQEYARGLYESGLLQWMTKQPLVAIVGDALVVHGGVSDRVIDYVEAVARQQGMNVTDAIHGMTNMAFHRFFQQEFQKVNGANQIQARLTGGYVLEIIMDMVQHRGYFDRNRGCSEVDDVLGKLDAGLNRVVVGHTPHDYALELCNGKLLASDSSLSRSFRAHGNMYCPLRKSLVEEYGGGSRTCSKVHKEQCEGSISRITRASAKDAWPTSMQRFQFHELHGISSTIKKDETVVVQQDEL